ncbi:MAG: helix-hairpin-helix domain-containing protein [Candidatus Edwardsbacteria bacterium]
MLQFIRTVVNYTLLFLLYGFLVVSFSSGEELQLDLNQASFDQISSLPGITPEIAKRILERREFKSYFKSIYELREIKGIDGERFERIKPLIRISPSLEKRDISPYVEQLQALLATEESPTESALDEWEDLFINPLDLNRTNVDDLVLLKNVSLVDAVSVVRYIKTRGPIHSWRTLQRDVEGLSHFGLTNMRPYVTLYPSDSHRLTFQGYYRFKFLADNRLDFGEETENLAYKISTLQASLKEFDDHSPSSKGSHLRQAGWTEREISYLRNQIQNELLTLQEYPANGTSRHKLRINWGEKIKLGLLN